MIIEKKIAENIFREEAQKATEGFIDSDWQKIIQIFSNLCEEGVAKTHIAFLGTSILAKAVNTKVDLYAIKPNHAKGNANAYSARTLCHSILVPLAAELGISIGVTGREPLNNQPYFRMTSLGDKTPIHSGGRPAFDKMMEIIANLSQIDNQIEALQPLRAFIFVRRQYFRQYEKNNLSVSIVPYELSSLIEKFVHENSEGGRLAQAVVAGLIDVFAGFERVDCGRINDPSRKYPGDVCIRNAENPDIIEKTFEVRDKPVAESDIYIFGLKCVDMKIQEAAVVMVSSGQSALDTKKISEWAGDLGLGMTLFHNWHDFVDQVLFWSASPKQIAAAYAAERIEIRLISVEASSGAVTTWQNLVRKKL